MFRPRAIRPANATRADPVWAKRVACVARLLVAAVALWIMAAPLQAAERETRVLVLNGADPYLPAYRVIDSSMRETLAKTRRYDFSSSLKHSTLIGLLTVDSSRIS